MAIYRQINITFWQDDFVLELTPEEKFFYLYLMTNSKTTQCGIYELPKKIIEFETGYNSETVDKLLKRLIEYQKIRYDDATKEVMLLNWIKYNASTSPKVKKCIEKELKSVKNAVFLQNFLTLCKEYQYSIDTVCIQKRNNNNNNNNNKNKNKNNNKTLINSLWENFYKLYPHKVNKKKAQDKYISILKNCKNANDKADEILTGLKRYVAFWEKEKTEQQFIPHPTTWLNGERWNDDVKDQKTSGGLSEWD